MNAIREFHTVSKDKNIKISIPDSFNATEVEVIVLPKRTEYFINEETRNMVMERKAEYLKNPDKLQDFGNLKIFPYHIHYIINEEENKWSFLL